MFRCSVRRGNQKADAWSPQIKYAYLLDDAALTCGHAFTKYLYTIIPHSHAHGTDILVVGQFTARGIRMNLLRSIRRVSARPRAD